MWLGHYPPSHTLDKPEKGRVAFCIGDCRETQHPPVALLCSCFQALGKPRNCANVSHCIAKHGASALPDETRMAARVLHLIIGWSVPRFDEIHYELPHPPAGVLCSPKSARSFADEMRVSKDLSRQRLILFDTLVDSHS
jgi:hypothetical protein